MGANLVRQQNVGLLFWDRGEGRRLAGEGTEVENQEGVGDRDE